MKQELSTWLSWKIAHGQIEELIQFCCAPGSLFFLSLKTGKCCIGLGRRWARCPFSYFIYTSAFPMWKCVGEEKHGALRHKRQIHSQMVGAAVHCRRKYSHSKCVNTWYWRFGKILQELQWLGKIGRFWAVDKGEIKELQSFLTSLF